MQFNLTRDCTQGHHDSSRTGRVLVQQPVEVATCGARASQKRAAVLQRGTALDRRGFSPRAAVRRRGRAGRRSSVPMIPLSFLLPHGLPAG